MKQIDAQRGFSAIIVLVAIVVVAGLGFVAWRISRPPDTGKTPGSNTRSQDQTTEKAKSTDKAFNCQDMFTVFYPDSLRASMTDAGQCLISNVSTEEMPPVGPLPPGQLGLFFNTQATQIATSDKYLDDYIKRSQEDFALELRSQESIKLDNGSLATLASIFGGHPTKHDFYFFIYIKDGTAITTSYPINSNHKETALSILKSIK
jgi:hypothetical protein